MDFNELVLWLIPFSVQCKLIGPLIVHRVRFGMGRNKRQI